MNIATAAILASIATPVGPLTVIAEPETAAVLAAGFTDDSDRLVQSIHPSLRRELRTSTTPGATIADAVEQYFEGDIRSIDAIAVRQRSSALRERGWLELRNVAGGNPISYGGLAERLEVPRGARAAGQICARNAVALFVPCHRVVRSDGSPNHYAWGLGIKVWLLEFEASHS